MIGIFWNRAVNGRDESANALLHKQKKRDDQTENIPTYTVRLRRGCTYDRLPLHRIKEFGVRLRILHFTQQELDRRQFIHRM